MIDSLHYQSINVRMNRDYYLVPIQNCLSLIAINCFQYMGDELHRQLNAEPDTYLVDTLMKDND